MSEEHSFGTRGADAEDSAEGPSFLERLAGYFRGRPGTARENIADALAEGGEDPNAFSPAERAMLTNVLGLREISVEDVMIPRADIEAIEINTKLADLLGIFERSGHSRMPVYAGSLDDPRGLVHIRDVLAHITRNAREGEGAGVDLARVDLSETVENLNLIRTVHFVPPSMLVSDLMARMQASRIHVALVIDEYGGTDGLVSLEDILETVVGDIEDEHDKEEALVTMTGEGVYVADAKATIEEAVDVIGSAFAAGEHEDYVDTIGGMIVNELGRVPQRGEIVEAVPGFDFHVLEADPRRVKRVQIVRKTDTTAPAPLP
ncbi:MAG: magnesium/cobalt efflux protein [Mesorhizobium amorphae]|nr:MAG: magnesium/cobalt efflux protein [Mesorhizobium amorphae]